MHIPSLQTSLLVLSEMRSFSSLGPKFLLLNSNNMFAFTKYIIYMHFKAKPHAVKNRSKQGLTSLAVQLLRPHASNAGGLDSVPGWGTKIPHAM